MADGLSVWSAAFSTTHYQTPPASLSLPRKKCSHFQERDWPKLGHVFNSESITVTGRLGHANCLKPNTASFGSWVVNSTQTIKLRREPECISQKCC